ncbi:ribonuclease J [Isoalcanivorax indicus]|uniref:ribonuclease J n=1 Tax=Isoalcanivorax indicus TaxID=2202653 RepID=UPI000DBA2120|nr:ribonuclease J [Isoalcanivorax indicus]
MTPDLHDLWFLPLGGCGEIGMNLNLYGHNGQWLMVDCGITFARAGDPDHHGADIQMADPGFISARREQLAGLLITHAHEDHIGAVAWLWPLLRCPVYATPFATEVLRRKLAERGLSGQVPLIDVQPGQGHHIGVFHIRYLHLTHSVPEPNGVVIETPAGRIFHTGDWKLDPAPVVGPGYSASLFRQLGDDGVDAMVCDSTNALVTGHSGSEGSLYAGLRDAIQGAPGRVVVACFGSNIARLHTLGRIAHEANRYFGLLGRSLVNMVSAARATGVWQAAADPIDSGHLGYLPAEEVLAVATGSQGEPRTALHRLADDSHPDLSLEPGDRVIFSARVIPGNEEAVARLIERLQQRGVEVITDDDAAVPIHASGHPASEELLAMYGWVRPRLAIPVHGEAAHMAANAALARHAGVPRQLTGRNGDLFMIAPVTGLRRQVAPVGRWGVARGQLAPLPASSTK